LIESEHLLSMQLVQVVFDEPPPGCAAAQLPYGLLTPLLLLLEHAMTEATPREPSNPNSQTVFVMRILRIQYERQPGPPTEPSARKWRS
jgi:hypothetical protein